MTGYIQTEFIVDDKDYDKMSADMQAAIREYFKGEPYPANVEAQISAEIEKQKGLGYGYSEIQRINSIKLKDVNQTNALFSPAAIIRLPHTEIQVPKEYDRERIRVNYTAPKYTKQRNSQGAALEDLLAGYFRAKEAEKAAQEAQEAQEREARAKAKEEEDRKRAEKKAEQEALKKPEHDFIDNWIQENGSDRLKKARELGLAYIRLFKKEWSLSRFGPGVRVFNNRNWINEFEPGTPSLENMEKYEAGIQKANSIKEFFTGADLSDVRIEDPEEAGYYDPDELPAPKLAIVYEVNPVTIDTFWIVDFLE